MQTTHRTTALGPQGYAGLEPTNPPDWHGLVVWDTFFNALATGLFLATAAGEFAAPAAFAPITVWAYPLSLLLLLVDLSLLVLDLGDPLRFHHMLRVFKPTSPMSLGTWCLTAYSVPLTLIVATDLFIGVGWAHRILVLVALPFAFGSAAYKGVLFSTTAQPGWRDARWLGAYHMSGAVLFGCAELLLIGVLTGNEAATAAARPALALLIVLNLAPLALLVRELGPALSRAYAPAGRARFAEARWLGGVIAPLAFLVAGESIAEVLAGILILVTGHLVRSEIVWLPHAVHRAGPLPERPAVPVSRPS